MKFLGSGVFRDLFQDIRIDDAQEAAETARRQSSNLESEIGRLRQQVQRLQLVCEAMWELLRDGHGLQDQQLADKLQEVAESHKLSAKKSVVCPACQRNNAGTIAKCLYCGEPLGDANMFR